MARVKHADTQPQRDTKDKEDMRPVRPSPKKMKPVTYHEDDEVDDTPDDGEEEEAADSPAAAVPFPNSGNFKVLQVEDVPMPITGQDNGNQTKPKAKRKRKRKTIAPDFLIAENGEPMPIENGDAVEEPDKKRRRVSDEPKKELAKQASQRMRDQRKMVVETLDRSLPRFTHTPYRRKGSRTTDETIRDAIRMIRFQETVIAGLKERVEIDDAHISGEEEADE